MTETKKIRIRVSVTGNYSNQPDNLRATPQQKYPVGLVVQFDKKENELAALIKDTVNNQNPVNIRFDKHNMPDPSHCFIFYCKNADAMKPILSILRGNELFEELSIKEQKSITTFQMIEEARSIIGKYNMERSRF